MDARFLGKAMESYQGPERREHRRVRARLVVGYRLPDTEEEFAFTLPSDVSQGGLRLHTDRPYGPGTRLAVSISPRPRAPALEVTGEVLASQEVVEDAIYDTRLRFRDLNAESLYLLGEFIRTTLTEGA